MAGPSEESSKSGSPIVTVLRQSQGRQRKGSLRQAAMAKMRERSGSATRPADWYEDHSHTIDAAKPLSKPAYTSTHESLETLLESPMTSSVGPYASTTDEDDHLSFYRPPTTSSTGPYTVSSQGPVVSLSRRRSNRSDQRSTASALPAAPETDVDDEWDYSETEWWGWIVLIATWIVFVVGMGSCLGVWSWAWDVGETPYAPPDLEDDDTLPITGYYPALMVCTAVMAWVWVVVAWVGMKYFRHAKVGVDS